MLMAAVINGGGLGVLYNKGVAHHPPSRASDLLADPYAQGKK
jgi:hypothetical protein